MTAESVICAVIVHETSPFNSVLVTYVCLSSTIEIVDLISLLGTF